VTFQGKQLKSIEEEVKERKVNFVHSLLDFVCYLNFICWLDGFKNSDFLIALSRQLKGLFLTEKALMHL
jgi:hypothetical protein